MSDSSPPVGSHTRASNLSVLWNRWEVPWTKTPWFLGLLIVLAVIAVYSNNLRGDWLYDDYADILGNQSIQKIWPLKAHFLQTIKGETGVHPRPLVGLTFTLNFLLGHNDPFVFHLTNVAIHALASLFLFDLLRQTLRRGADQTPCSANLLAFMIALLWGIHPLQTESVAYITQRYESIMGLFVLLTLLCVTRGAQARHGRGWTMAAALFCLFALASKEVAVSLPILALLYDRTFLTGSFRGAWRARRPLYLTLGVTWALFAWNQSHVAGRHFAGFELPWTWWQYAINQPAVILHYLRLAVWPHPLILDYLWQPATSVLPLLPGFLVVGILLVTTVVALIRNTWMGFLGAFFFLVLAPTSSVLPILDLAVEHRMYLPLAPVIVCIVVGAQFLTTRLTTRYSALAHPARLAMLACGASFVALLGSLTYLRNDDYRSSLSIWMDTVIKRPNNPRAHANYAHALQRAGNIDEAIAQARFAVKLAPSNVTMRGNLGAYLEEKGLREEAIQAFEEAIRLDPRDPRPWVNLGEIYIRMKDFTRAETCLKKALALDSTSAQAHFEMGNLLVQIGDAEKAMVHYREAMRLQPGFSLSHWGAGNLLLKQGRKPEALQELEAYIGLEMAPNRAERVVGQVLLKHGHIDEAYDYWRRTIQRDPADVQSMLILSWSLATHPNAAARNGAEALKLAEAALRASKGRAPATLEVLATAYAELGRYQEACTATEEALALLKAKSVKDLAEVQARLELFRVGKPYREDPAKGSAR